MSQISLAFLFLAIAAGLLIRNILRADVVAILLVLALGLSGILTPQETFSGFGRPAVMVMFSAFILADGLRRVGITERLGAFIVHLFGKGEGRLTFGVMTAGAILSLFMNNIAAASLLFPSLSGVSQRSQVSPSRLLMPLAFGTILGGTATLLTTTNIIVSSLLRNANLPSFGLLEFAPIGLPIAFAGIFFMVFVGRKFLPDKSPAQQMGTDEGDSAGMLSTYQLNDRLLRGRIRLHGWLDGKTVETSGLRERYHLNILAIKRDKHILPLEPQTKLKWNDILLIMARPEDTLPAHIGEFLDLLPLGNWQEDYLSTPNMMLIETAIAPRSHLGGQTFQDIHFEQKFDARVLALWRRGRSIRTRLENLPLEFGDGLLLHGSAKSLDLLRTEPGLILLAESAPTARMGARGWLTAAIMLITLASGVALPNLIAEVMLTGAICMVLLQALNMDQAYRAIEWRSLFLVAGMLPVAIALEKTGGAALIAHKIIGTIGVFGHFALLAGFVIMTVLLTQIINGASAVTVIAPIAITTAQVAGMDPRSVALAVAIASSMAFMSPLGHAVNVMVMGAGGYSFRDYFRVGFPLTIILVIILLIILPLIMPIG